MERVDRRTRCRVVWRTFAGAVAVALVCAGAANRFAPYPSANTDRASEDPFATGLHQREFLGPLGGPGRWTTTSSSYAFENLPAGPKTLEVRVRNHQHRVRVLADREPLGVILVDARGGDFALPREEEAEVHVDLLVRTFPARGGRHLGTSLDRVTVIHQRSWFPPARLALLFVATSLAVAAAALMAGIGGSWAGLLSALTVGIQTLLLWPHGILRSDYASTLSVMLVVGAVASCAFARWMRRFADDVQAWAFFSFLVAFLVQIAAATHPLVIGFDAVFHGHKLAAVAAGDLFPISFTQHRPPFSFPYGVSFYALLTPFVWLGLDIVTIVRWGAACSGLVGSAALFWLVAGASGGKERPSVAALAVFILQWIPLTFEVYSNANLSNIFAQTAAFVFFVWWAGGKPGGWPVGALFLIAGFYGHLSILIFLVILVASLLLCHRRELAEHRQGVVAVLVGLVGAALYYFQFHEMIFEQLPRLLEGGRGGAGARGLVDSLLIQLNEAINQWGVPVIVLAILGKWRSGRLDNSLKAYWMAGAVLAIAAVVSPMEVRYQYALVLPLAISAAEGARFLVTGGMRQSGLSGWLVLLGWGLLGAQTALGIHGIANALLYAWRV